MLFVHPGWSLTDPLRGRRQQEQLQQQQPAAAAKSMMASWKVVISALYLMYLSALGLTKKAGKSSDQPYELMASELNYLYYIVYSLFCGDCTVLTHISYAEILFG